MVNSLNDIIPKIITNYFQTKHTMRNNYLLLLLTLLLCSLHTGCATSPTGRNQLMLVSPETAISASKEAYINTMTPLNAEGKIDNDPAVTGRVRKITGRLVHEAIEMYPYTESWEWAIKVIDDPEMVNAWCMAGGKMAVYSGLLIKITPTDDELAQVLAHEIGHALSHHTAEKMSVAMASNIGLMGVAIAVSGEKHAGLAMAGTAAAAALAVQLPNSRAAEEEADRIGIELAARAGYDPDAAVTLWQKMGETGGSGPPEFLSTHPSPSNRQETLKRLGPEMMPYYTEKKNHLIYVF
jgi:predicted Zn-dependent protease